MTLRYAFPPGRDGFLFTAVSFDAQFLITGLIELFVPVTTRSVTPCPLRLRYPGGTADVRPKNFLFPSLHTSSCCLSQFTFPFFKAPSTTEESVRSFPLGPRSYFFSSKTPRLSLL